MLHTCAANLAALQPHHRAATLLAAVASATSHQQCSAALAGLRALAATQRGAEAVCHAAWRPALGRLLEVVPANDADKAVWAEALALLRAMLACGELRQVRGGEAGGRGCHVVVGVGPCAGGEGEEGTRPLRTWLSWQSPYMCTSCAAIE